MSASAFASFTTPDWAKKSADQCAACSGTGSTDCTWCSGTGKMSAAGTSYTCPTCSGTGKVQCLGCSGTGKKRELKKENPITIPGDPTFDCGLPTYPLETGVTCPICNGAGQRVCSSCSGYGYTETMNSSANYGYGSTPYWTKKSCAACHHTGLVPCTYCGGDGVR